MMPELSEKPEKVMSFSPILNSSLMEGKKYIATHEFHA